MAKVRSIIQLRGTIDGITYVNSQAYGSYARAARGTYTPITLSDGMKASSLRQGIANKMAKVIFDEVNEFAPGFKNGKFWSRLVKVFRMQQKVGDAISYLPFEKIEMREDYPSIKHGAFYLKRIANRSAMMLSYTFYGDTIEKAFAISILRMATDETFLTAYPSSIAVSELKGGLNPAEFVFDFPELPDGAKCLYVLKCERLEDGMAEGTLAAKSVTFLRVV